MFPYLQHIAVSSLAAVIFLSAATPAMARKKEKKQSVPVVVLSHNDQLRYNYFFLEAARQHTMGHDAAAFSLLKHAQYINPNGAEVYFQQAMFYADMKKQDQALACMEKAAQLNPSNLTYLESVGQFYINKRDYDKAIGVYERLADANHTNSNPLNILAQLYHVKKDYPNVIKTLDRIEVIDGVSERLTLGKVQIYQLMDDTQSAYTELKNLADSHPNDFMYRIKLGNWLMQNDRKDEAYDIYQGVLREEPENSDALSCMYDYYNATNQDSLASVLLKRLLLSAKTSVATKATLMRSFIGANEQKGGDSTVVIRLFDDMLALKQENADIAELKAAYMKLKKMPDDEVNKALNKALEIAPDRASARMQLVQNLWYAKKYDDVIAACISGTQYNPSEMGFYFFLGQAYFMIHKNQEALTALRKGVRMVTSNDSPELVSDFYAMMGDLLHELGQDKEAFAAYDSCLQWKDDHIVCKNNYAYYLSEKNLNLGKAEELSHQVILAEPENATFLDTYAWVLFCEEKYAEAKVYIDQAIQHMDSTANTTIKEHAGDIYSMNGMPDEAVKYWKMSVESGNSSDIVARKIKNRKFIKK